MGDTIIVSNFDSLQDVLKDLQPSLRDSVTGILKDTEVQVISNNPPPGFNGHVIANLFIVMVVLCVLYLIYSVQKERKNGTAQGDATASAPNGYFYYGKDILLAEGEMAGILQKRFAYYNALSEEMKAGFRLRLLQFMQTKIFHLPKEETYKDIPVLISAVAVQLTFGLPGSELPWFRYINVTEREFNTGDELHPHLLEGNVEGHSVNIAWNHFLEGIADCEDGCNVGLHELAHAMYYEYIAVERGSDRRFTAQLRKVMHEIETIYKRGEYGQILFSGYAFRNTQECWAESIELFFEKPDAMRTRFPDLFFHLTQLLQQDPRNKSNPVLSE